MVHVEILQRNDGTDGVGSKSPKWYQFKGVMLKPLKWVITGRWSDTSFR